MHYRTHAFLIWFIAIGLSVCVPQLIIFALPTAWAIVGYRRRRVWEIQAILDRKSYDKSLRATIAASRSLG